MSRSFSLFALALGLVAFASLAQAGDVNEPVLSCTLYGTGAGKIRNEIGGCD